MKLRSEVQWQREGERPGFLFDPRLGGLFGLNDTSCVVLEGLARGLDEETLVREIQETFDVPELTARVDLSAFLNLLMEHDLVSLDV